MLTKIDIHKDDCEGHYATGSLKDISRILFCLLPSLSHIAWEQLSANVWVLYVEESLVYQVREKIPEAIPMTVLAMVRGYNDKSY